MKLQLTAVCMILVVSSSLLANEYRRQSHFIKAEIGDHNLRVTTEPDAIVVISQGSSNGLSFQANARGALTIPLSKVPTGPVTISALIPVSDKGSQSQPGSSFYFVPGSGLSVGNHFYIATQLSFTNTDQIDSDIALTYGTGARLARWEDLVSDSISNAGFAALFLEATALPVEGSVDCRYPNLYVSKGGQEFDGTRGRWFITNFRGGSLSACDYASFGNVSNSIFLGSYNWPGQALVYIPSALYQPSVAAQTKIDIR